MNILFAEDDESLGKVIHHLLQKEFGRVDWVKDGKEACEFASFTEYDVIILDWMMPKRSGIEACIVLRRNRFKGGILFLTAKDSIEDVVQGLNTGADDYLIKPFKFEELSARIRALSRRMDKPYEEILTYDDFKLNLSSRCFQRNGEVIELSKKEFDLLELLFRHQNQVLTREVLIDRIWGFEVEITENALDALVKLVRKKVDKPDSPSIIKNVRGVGYKLREINV